MGITQITTAIAVALSGLLPTSCHKTAPQTKHAPPPSAAEAVVSHTWNLGDVALTNHYETSVSLGDGKNCTLTPNMLDKHNVQIMLQVKSRTAAGKIQDMSVTQFVTRSGKPTEIDVGSIALTLTPQVVSQ